MGAPVICGAVFDKPLPQIRTERILGVRPDQYMVRRPQLSTARAEFGLFTATR